MKPHISFLCRIVTTSILISVCTGTMIGFFGNRLKSHYMAVADTQADKVASLVTLNTVASLLKDSYSQVPFLYDDDDVLFNTGQLNALLRDSVNEVYREIRKIEEGTSDIFEGKYGKGIIYEIPFHLFSDNVLFSTFGPKIPVRFSLLGDVKGQILSTVEEFGINNALITLNLVMDVSSRVSVPMTSSLIKTQISVPVYSRLFTGKIPTVFYGPIQGVDSIYSSEVAI